MVGRPALSIRPLTFGSANVIRTHIPPVTLRIDEVQIASAAACSRCHAILPKHVDDAIGRVGEASHAEIADDADNFSRGAGAANPGCRRLSAGVFEVHDGRRSRLESRLRSGLTAHNTDKT